MKRYLTEKNAYFEGWYLKHQNKAESISLIPAYHIDPNGNQSALLQIICQNTSYQISYPIQQCFFKRKPFCIKMGDNCMTQDGISLKIETNNLSLSGDLVYGNFTPLPYDIMGPFTMVPFMQCRHGVLSLYHSISGRLTLNKKHFMFQDDTGYIETDRGTSFPKAYLWTQVSWQKNSLLLSIGNIPFLNNSFWGTICSIWYQNREYRLATYLGAKIEVLRQNQIIVRQGSYRFSVQVLQKNTHPLLAPVDGKMIRTIHQSIDASVRYQFCQGNNILFDMTSTQASFECAGL